MAAYVDFDFYAATFLGDAIAQADFDRLALRATEQIDQLTFGRAEEYITADTAEQDAAMIALIQMATCAVAEAIQSNEAGGQIQSERVGQHSVTYSVATPVTKQAAISKAAKLYLGRTGLMYRGMDEGV